MHHKRTANQCKGPWSLHTALVALMMCSVLWPQASCEDIAIETLPPDYSRRPAFESANALLSEWEGDHWASLDADQDKVALSWTTTSDEAIFQVSKSFWLRLGCTPTSLRMLSELPSHGFIYDNWLFVFWTFCVGVLNYESNCKLKRNLSRFTLLMILIRDFLFLLTMHETGRLQAEEYLLI